VMPCGLVCGYQHFEGGMLHLHHHGRSSAS
jgi:hypothetical protein